MRLNKGQNSATMIDHNTLYTQYKPHQSHQQNNLTNHNEPNLISTSSASSTSTASCSSTSSSSSSSALVNNTQSSKSYFANRDSLFYHSTDNHRYNPPVLNNSEQQHFRDKQRRILEQQHQQLIYQNQHVSRILDSRAIQVNRTTYNQSNVKHSTPVNVSSQIHTVCDMFEEDNFQKNDHFINNFNRYGRNQLSTKSNPPATSELTQSNPSFLKNQNNTIIEDEYFHRSFKTNFNQNFHNTKLNFNLQTPVIIPHPAQV